MFNYLTQQQIHEALAFGGGMLIVIIGVIIMLIERRKE